MGDAKRDANSITTLLGVSNADDITPIPVYVDPVTHRMLVSSSGGGGGAPTDATYITQTANGTLTNEQVLGALATGLLKNTTTTGILSIALADTDYLLPTTAASTYVPYSGATADVDLGGYILTAAVTKTSDMSFLNDAGFSMFSDSGATPSNLLRIYNNISLAAILDVSGINTTDKTFTFPNASGTLALTSDLAAYQPVDADLTAIAALGFTATAFLKKTAANTWALDTNTYLTAEADTLASVMARGATTGVQLTSTLAIGTSPFAITSTTLNTNLNADLLDGNHSSAFQSSLTFPLASNLGGTGVANNVASTITITGSYALGLTLSAATSLTLPTSGTVTALGNTTTGSGSIVLASSPVLVTPTLGVATATTLNALTLTALATGFSIAGGTTSKTLTVNETASLTDYAKKTDNLSVFAATTSLQLLGVISDETGTGALVFANTPTLVTPVLGAATATSIAIGANTLNTTEWAFLDGIDQALKTTSTPQFARLGLGVAADGTDVLAFPAAATITNAGALSWTLNTDVSSGNVYGFTGDAGAQLTGSSGIQRWFSINADINQSGTAGYVGLYVNVVETATGSGSKRVLDFSVGGSTKFMVFNDGAFGNLAAAGYCFAPEIRATGDIGGSATGTVMCMTNTIATVSTGVGTVLMSGTTARNSAGWLKFYRGTTAYYMPMWSTIT